MERILKYIEEHICEPLTIKELAETAGYSEYHFLRRFKEYTNMTCMHYIWKRRLVKASEDIAAGVRIIDAALEYGWQSHSAFTRSFKREFGFAPSLLRTMRVGIDCLGGGYMNSIFLKRTKVGASKEELLQILKTSMEDNGAGVNQELLNRLYLLACNAYDDMKRYSGEEYVTHPMNVSIILSEMGAEENVILAGLFCDAGTKGVMSLEQVEKELPAQIADIVSDLKTTNRNLNHASEEVVQIRLAQRLHNMRTVDYIGETEKNFRIKETIEIFMPLARKMNNMKLIDELTDLTAGYDS